MTETTQAPGSTWIDFLKLPLVDKVVMALLGFLLGYIAVPWASAKFTIPAADPPKPAMSKQVDDAVNRLDGRLSELLGKVGEINDRVVKIEGKRDLALDQVEALRGDWKTSTVRKPVAPPLK